MSSSDNKSNDEKKLYIGEECTGCGTCMAMHPEIFEFNDEGKAKVKDDAELEGVDLDELAQICPMGAIKIRE
jgi:ferredoxin